MSAFNFELAHMEFIKTPKQLVILIIIAFAAPILFFFMLATLVTSGFNLNMKSPAMSPEAVAERLKPVGQVVVAAEGASVAEDKKTAQPADPAPAGKEPAATSAAAAKEPAVSSEPADKPQQTGGESADGKSVYSASCAACHDTGLAEAPKAGDKAQWAPRIVSGTDAMYASALKGKGLMPAKGGNPALSDAQVKAAVDYLVGLVE